MDAPPLPEDQLFAGNFDTKNKEILKYIERQIAKMDFDALTQICHIIKANDEKFTAKKDVALVNLGTLKPETVKEMVHFILFLSKNETLLNKDEQLKSQMKQQYEIDSP